MKKNIILLPAALAVTIGLTACSTNSQSNLEKKETKVASAATQTDLKRPLVRFFRELSKKINGTDAALNAYESSQKPTTEMKAKASESASDVSNQLKQIQIPSELYDQKVQLKTAIKDISDSYSAKAEELKKDVPSLDLANATFAKGVEELGKVFENNKLLKPNLGLEVN